MKYVIKTDEWGPANADFLMEVLENCKGVQKNEMTLVQFENYIYDNEAKFTHPTYYGALLAVTGLLPTSFNGRNIGVCQFINDFLTKNNWKTAQMHPSTVKALSIFEANFSSYLKENLENRVLN